MHNLPLELLHKIFILLHQKDKLECMSVCSKWRHVIDSFNSLFHTIRISNEDQLCKLIQKVRQEPNHGMKAERLIFDVDYIKHDKLDILPFLFPNISVFIFSKTFDQCDIPLTKKLLPHPWHNNIQHMAEYLRNAHTIQTLSSSMCSQLTTLTIYGKMGQSGKDLVDLLANAPSLRSLSISFYSFTLADFELLHENAPLLSSLSIENADLICNILPSTTTTTTTTTSYSSSSSDIKPSTTMTTFNLKPSSVYPASHEIVLLQYLCKKYPNLVELSHGVYVLNEEECSEERVLRDGYAPLMESLGSKLKSFSLIYYDMDRYPFEVMDRAGCQINDLTLSYIQDYAMIQLAQSNQVKYIKKLTLTALLKFSTLDWLREFEVLKELTLCFPDPGDDRRKKMQKIYLDDILKHVGNTLEMLKLGGVQVSCSSSSSSTGNRCYTSVKTIMFGNVSLPPDLDDFISHSFPNLRNLVFDHCFWSRHTFTLPHVNLSTLKVIEDFGDLDEDDDNDGEEGEENREDKDEKMLVKTLSNNEQRWYSAKAIKNILYYEHQFDAGDLAVYPSMTSLPFERFNGQPFITFVCHSLQNVFMVNSIC